MDIALFNTRITFQKNTLVVDAIGNHKNQWSDYFSCAASISGESSRDDSEKQTAGQTVESPRCAFTVRWCSETASITEDGYRILWNGDFYNITSIDHQNNKRKSLKFWCQKVRR